MQSHPLAIFFGQNWLDLGKIDIAFLRNIALVSLVAFGLVVKTKRIFFLPAIYVLW